MVPFERSEKVSDRRSRQSPKLDIDYIARLARLSLTPQEKKSFSRQLSDVLVQIEELKKLEVEKVEPTFQTTGAADVFRKDEIQEERILTDNEALANAKETARGHFRVPKVI